MQQSSKWSTVGMPIVITIIVAGAIIGILASSSSSPTAATASSSSLVAEHQQYSFGTIPQSKGVVTHDYPMENSGTQSVTIRRVVTSCMCTKARIVDASGSVRGEFGMPGHGTSSGQANITVGAGERIVVRALFDPNAHGPSGVGAVDRVITIEIDSKETPTLQLGFTGTIIP